MKLIITEKPSVGQAYQICPDDTGKQHNPRSGHEAVHAGCPLQRTNYHQFLLSELGTARHGQGERRMKQALVVIDIQNDITKHYKDIIHNLNTAIEWAEKRGMYVVYIKHHNITAGTRTFKPDTKGAELVPELKVVSDHIFVKTKSNALTSEAFSAFISDNGIGEFYIAGADATACVKSTCFNMTKAGYTVHVISDCVTSYDLKKVDEMLDYYAKKGCEVKPLSEYMN